MARKTASDFFDKAEQEDKKVSSVKEESKDHDKKETVKEKETFKEKESNDKTELFKTEDEKSISAPSVPSTLTQEEYMKQYQQYMHQYQQYYAHYYSQNYTSAVSTASDPAYEYFSGSSAATTAPPAVSFDASRASRQMSAYFDPTKFQTVLSPEMLAAQRAQKEQQQSKLTTKEIEAFKKKKIEKKKAKNRWFYE